MIRLFVGLALPAEHRQHLAALQHGLKDARWVAPENLHITVRFIGEVDEDVAEEICGVLNHIRADPFGLTIQDLGTFGRPPHALWTGVEDDAGGALAHLHANVESALVRLGLAPEGRKYTPHVTLARFRKSAHLGRLDDFLEAHGALALQPFTVDGFTLFESHLSHLGAQYTPYAEFDF